MIKPGSYPQVAAPTAPAQITGLTLTAIDTLERGMSLTQQPEQASPPPAEASRGERIAILIGIAVTVLATAGILFIFFGRGQDSEVPGGSPTASAASPSPAAPRTAEDAAAAEAKTRYLEFIRVRNQVAQGGYNNSQPYATVAVSPEYGQLILEARRFAALRSTGDARVVAMTVESVDLPNNPSEYPSVRLRTCLDVAQVDVLDENGRSVVAANRPDRASSTVLLQKYKPGDIKAVPGRGGWFVVEVEKRDEPC